MELKLPLIQHRKDLRRQSYENQIKKENEDLDKRITEREKYI